MGLGPYVASISGIASVCALTAALLGGIAVGTLFWSTSQIGVTYADGTFGGLAMNVGLFRTQYVLWNNAIVTPCWWGGICAIGTVYNVWYDQCPPNVSDCGTIETVSDATFGLGVGAVVLVFFLMCLPWSSTITPVSGFCTVFLAFLSFGAFVSGIVIWRVLVFTKLSNFYVQSVPYLKVIWPTLLTATFEQTYFPVSLNAYSFILFAIATSFAGLLMFVALPLLCVRKSTDEYSGEKNPV
mmetsp:Transcript_4713/g.7329  ORF Transcript_4713/g.7329 Transcript_4713/m.7329 type:complete len:241 (+) Transcript_4713:186-908(+)|eukprot:CAMPEP_0184646206 /NCGR_PEP_ID=MMETSP0308-20130426/2861_1 /TAXON_ID=38269 /ORGANISM="Gloeochaete witrockiana, Strain SAG 46.84" /LENGTH=240 /DNA_ID=CAMNT_0027075991 /DNA_START=139 /DNA_END=861 /DNA_ORIENTATION=+